MNGKQFHSVQFLRSIKIHLLQSVYKLKYVQNSCVSIHRVMQATALSTFQLPSGPISPVVLAHGLWSVEE